MAQPWDPAGWSNVAWGFYVAGALYLVMFFGFFAAFRSAERRARSGNAQDLQRYNRLLRGFPNAFYAKMMGRRPLEPPPAERGQGSR